MNPELEKADRTMVDLDSECDLDMGKKKNPVGAGGKEKGQRPKKRMALNLKMEDREN